jgi:hypothetical protein
MYKGRPKKSVYLLTHSLESGGQAVVCKFLKTPLVCPSIDITTQLIYEAPPLLEPKI